MTRLLCRSIPANWCRLLAISVSPSGLSFARSERMFAELRPLALGREALADLPVERDQADRVLLVDHQVAERRGEADRVLELGQLLAIGVAHRPREVHHQVARQVRLGLEFLRVEAVGLGVDVPVDVRDVVAGRVLAVLGELDREAVERAGVQAGDEALDDELRPQVEPRDLADHLGLQILLGGRWPRRPRDRGRGPVRRSSSSAIAEAGQERRLVDVSSPSAPAPR